MSFLDLFRRGKPAVSLDEIRRSFNEAAADEEHFPSTIHNQPPDPGQFPPRPEGA